MAEYLDSAGLETLVNQIKNAFIKNNITVSATTLSAGSSATVTYNKTNNTLTFGIPKGDKGATGDASALITKLNGTTTTGREIYAPTTAGTGKQFLYSSGSGAPSWSDITDNNSATALYSTNMNLISARSFYYATPTINGSHAYTSSTNIYAPTSAGTKGEATNRYGSQTLLSNGSGAPSWTYRFSTSTALARTSVATGTSYSVAFSSNLSASGLLCVAYGSNSRFSSYISIKEFVTYCTSTSAYWSICNDTQYINLFIYNSGDYIRVAGKSSGVTGFRLYWVY